MHKTIDNIIINALKEDIPTIDITTDNLFTNEVSEGFFVAKESGIISGVEVMKRVFNIVDEDIYIKVINGNGFKVDIGDVIAIISGKSSSILKGERVALNLFQRMCGVATLTNEFVVKVGNLNTKILDTRKTTPNLRILEKMAVLHGGGTNHRYSLSDQVMIKDNHIKAAGSITKAVEIIKSKIDHSIKIEVEVEDYNQDRKSVV